MNKNKSFVFIDAEYCYTCSMREGMNPNYRNIVEMLNNNHSDCTKIVYHVGDKQNKKGLCDFLFKIGVDYNIVMEFFLSSKTQIIGSCIAIDSLKYLAGAATNDCDFIFMSGDDYLIPIIDELHRKQLNIFIYYFPPVLSKELDKFIEDKNVIIKPLKDRYFNYPKKKL